MLMFELTATPVAPFVGVVATMLGAAESSSTNVIACDFVVSMFPATSEEENLTYRVAPGTRTTVKAPA
jgi:hypothetical protein